MRSSLLALFLGGLLFLTPKTEAQPAPVPSLTADQWREDLRFVATELRSRHANPYHHVSKGELDAAIASLDARIPGLRRNQIIVEMMRIVAMVGDGHTRIDPRKDPAFAFPSLPVKLYLFDDGLFIRAAAPGQEALVGAKVEAIGGVPVSAAISRAAALASRDNISGPRLFVPIYLAMPDILEAIGLSADSRTATLTLRKGAQTWTQSLAAAQVDPAWPPDTDISLVTPKGWADAHAGPPPMWLAAPLELYRLIELPERQAIYVQLNMVTDQKDENLTQFGERILKRAVAANPKAIIVDLRLNTGGNGDLRNGFIKSMIRAEDADTRLFVLTARGTFSASQFLLDDLDRLTGAMFIGEPASSRPTGYGDAFRSAMPNSGINIRTSIKYWQSGQDMRPFTPIDIAAPLTFGDYVAGRDPALEAALAFKTEEKLADQLQAAAKSGGSAASVKAATSYVDNPAHRYRDVERELIVSEQVLLERKQGAAALEVSRWAAKRFPRNSDLATVWAYVANAQGEKEEARRAIAAALAIDPSNRSAQSIKELIDNK